MKRYTEKSSVAHGQSQGYPPGSSPQDSFQGLPEEDSSDIGGGFSNFNSNDRDRNESGEDCSSWDSSSWGNTRTFTLGKIVACFICGVIFGFAMEKGRIFEPRYIRNQMVMKRMVMMKMFISAVASGMFGMSLLAMIPRTHRHFIRTCSHYFNHLSEKGILSSLVGGGCLGVGMVIAGTCPTSVFSQLGARLPNSEYTFAGALTGTLIYGICKPWLDKLFRPIIMESSNPWSSSPYFILALPLVAMFGILVCSFEILVPWTSDIKMRDPEGTAILNQKAWPPYVSGVIIGSLQVPLILALGETLGGSSSLLTMVSQVFRGPLRHLSPFLCQYKNGFSSWWQIFYVIGVIFGSYLSASLSGTLGTSKGVPPDQAFLGGALIMLGARIAGGCTSGHGLSGMGFLSILSFITVASMFGGAISTAFLMQSKGLLKIV